MLTFAVAPMLKRFVALLCIAIMTLVVVGHVDVASASQQGDAACSIACGTNDEGDTDKSSPAGQHHCCCTHPVSDPLPTAENTIASLGLENETMSSDRFVLSGLQYGPERPPRASAS